jgi:NCAIR mutase (PurE)-related protein
MNKKVLQDILGEVRSKKIGVDEALKRLKHFPYQDLGMAQIDTHRHLRVGFPEVIFCDGKTDDQIVKIVASMVKSKSPILATRISDTSARKLVKKYPRAKHNRLARTVLIGPPGKARRSERVGRVAVITAGTADIPVAEEAAVTCEAMGCNVEKLFDVGMTLTC